MSETSDATSSSQPTAPTRRDKAKQASRRRAAIIGRIFFAWMVLHLGMIYWGPQCASEAIAKDGPSTQPASQRIAPFWGDNSDM